MNQFNTASIVKSISQLEKLVNDASGNASLVKANIAAQLAYAMVLVEVLTAKQKANNAVPVNFTPEELELLRMGGKTNGYGSVKITLIKKIRERTGMGLAEAKHHVEQGHADIGYGVVDKSGSYFNFIPNQNYPR